MSKSFRDSYDGDGNEMKKINKSNKIKRQRVKDYLRRIDVDDFDEEEFENFTNDGNE